MPHGVPTPDDVVAEFRARYLYSGNASKVARDLKLDERTGRRIAADLEATEEFAAEVRAMHANALQRHITMRLRVAEIAAARLEEDMELPEVGEGANVTIIDKRPDYGKLVLEAEKNAQTYARLQAEREGTLQTEREVVIRVESFAGAKQAESPSGETP